MKNNKRKSSTAKKLLPAFTMLAVSAVSLASSTYAWFSLSKDVTVSGMSIKATSEGGLLITNEDASPVWATSAQATYKAVAELLPTSTADATNWYYNTSSRADEHQAAQPQASYTTLTLARKTTGTEEKPANGIGYDTHFANGFYLMNTFYIKSSTVELSENLYIKDLDVTATGSASQDLDKSIRVAVVMTPISGGGTAHTYIYNPLNGTASYGVNGESTGVTITPTPVNGATDVTTTSISKIPANTVGTDGAVKAEVYLYFEGEDENCKSSNITTASLDQLSVAIQFGVDQGGNSTYSSISGGNNNQQQQAASTPTGTYTITRTGTEGSYTYNYTKADGATFPTTGDYTWALNGGTAGTYAHFEAALASADFSGTVTVTVAANA